MLLGLSSTRHDFSLYALRRKDLLEMIKNKFPHIKNGLIVLIASFERDRVAFRQESSFYYLTGIEEPGIIFTMDFQGKTTLYVPHCKGNRAAWVHSPLLLNQSNAKTLHIDTITDAGQPIAGYQLPFFYSLQAMSAATDQIQSVINAGGSIFTLAASDDHSYVEQRIVLKRLTTVINNLETSLVDISEFLALMRRRKDMHEIEQLYKAVETTILAHEAAARTIADGITECEVQASLEYMFTGSCARAAFPSIVATGKNSTVLHYTANKDTLKNGQMVVVDIGAEYQYYCADLTRTYPVSGKFTARQKELYTIALETQDYIADLAKPGYWLSNKEQPEKSLHHLAIQFLEKKGYGNYFIHGIGHFLGMDVHDVGNSKFPLQEGDVFTIEPGIYIPEENLGIRIEDDYWMTKDSAICLSESLPKSVNDIEAMMASEDIAESEELEEESEDFDDQDLELARG